MSDKSDGELEETQKNQKKIGAAESNSKTTGPVEKLREDAAERWTRMKKLSDQSNSILFLKN